MLRRLCKDPITQSQKLWRVVSPRWMSSSSGQQEELTEGEKRLRDILKAKFPKASGVEVTDISGGCGAMYEVCIEAEEFRGHRTIKQHRMVNEALEEEIKMMHGLKINTAVPKS
ncbi:bolA-like protein 3 [Liolophura sinensis]|uniref:bolA-like protein 3 n=1 Tax=Liolophura sinensis TaxID=3198878 RepID=UPI003158AE09